MRKRLAFSWMGAVVLFSCRSSDLGSGLNTVDRDYARSASEVWDAAFKSVKSADFKIKEERHDEFGGELVSQRADGSDVRILIKSLDARTSRVSVRVEPGNRDVANLLQERIAENAGLGTAKPGIFGGNTLEGEYKAALSVLVESAHRSFRTLEIMTIGEEIHASWVALDGRLKDSTPVRIRLNKIEDLRTHVLFIAGTEKSDDNRACVKRLKDEFESSTPSEGSGR